ncbi:MAG: FAD-dependent oxidoreductase [Propionibacteriales bacterium]|nr:FAD-dependent oxidoreductase [Propionibacteriales bacterium]
MSEPMPMPMSMRLPAQPGEVIDREERFSFSWNGRSYPAYSGDTIASALAANGVRIFSRSFKYHRPRGLLTASHLDPGCTIQVGEEPNVRGAHRLASPGLDVRSQNTWPSLRYDVKSVNRLAGRFLSAGFYYKTFIKPRRLWPAYEKVLQRFVHGGVIPDRPEEHDAEARFYDKRYAHPDVLVAGGGPAGMAAACAAAEAGARVLLVEEEHRPGGHLRWGDAADLTLLAELRERVSAAGVEVMCDAVVLGRYDDNWVAVVERSPAGPAFERLVKARAETLVVAAGQIERPYVFAGNDLPGVMLSTAVRRLVNLYAVRPGERAVVLTANGSGDAAAADLSRVGVDVAAVVDARHGEDVVRADGRGGVRWVELGDGRRVDCDLLVTATGWTATTALLNMAGNRPVYRPEAARFVPDLDTLPDTVVATGGVVGDGTREALCEHGTAVGEEAARRAAGAAEQSGEVPSRAWPGVKGAEGARAPSAPHPKRPDAEGLTPEPHPELIHGRTHGFVDLCEDVTSKDLLSAVEEGYDSAELAKRYTTATMGPTQGKLEILNVVGILAEATGRTIQEVGTTTWRPPYAPVTLGALAGRRLEPVRHSPMQRWHEEHGAVPLVAGAWIRPDHYGDPGAEAANVRENVGIIDVTPIGKLDLQGPDVAKLLNLLYVNKWSKLEVGRVRYGVMCAEDGVVLDDGVTGRLGEDHYLMSTTSSGAAAVWEWVELWLQTEHPDWRVHVTPVTTAYASINVAGPKSRELMERVTTGVDLSPDAFPYMRVRRGSIAGVDDCVIWRIGFTGELSYEIHVPSAYGLHVWASLLAHGEDLGVAPFGIEAQRILRLEKGHLIVGQDTDGITQGYSADLDWAIKLDKPDFVGRPELAWQRQRGDHPRLVGLLPLDADTVPPEGCQLVEGAEIVGRITSSRRSPTLGRAICLGQVAAHLAEPGTEVTVRLPDGRLTGARVAEQLASVDPEGARLRV